MKRIRALVGRFVREEEGLELVEYAVMTALIVAALIAAILALSGAITTRFGEVETVIDAANT